MRLVPVVLLVVLGIIHAELWFGRGGVPRVNLLQQQLDAQVAENKTARERNVQLSAEVNDLQNGMESIEERARMELGMVKPNEIFVQVRP